MDENNSLKTPLYPLHRELGAKLVPFAGYDMPVQYPAGIMAEHNHTRESAGLFDVSHMGQATLIGPDHETVALALEALVPSDICSLQPGQMRYTVFLNEEGGILDDLIVTRPLDPRQDGELFLVVNAACKEQDFAHLAAHLPAEISLNRLDEKALIAVQGPKAAEVMMNIADFALDLGFMTAAAGKICGFACHISRSGYTGEDGFEISLDAQHVDEVARMILSDERVEPIGLGARDSLRLEAGLCLYGHDLDETTSPVEGNIRFVLSKRRREAGNFPGASRILKEFSNGPSRIRVGLRPDGRAPAREGAQIADQTGRIIGEVTSGGFAPSLKGPVAMGYVETGFAEVGTPLSLVVRAKALPAHVTSLPFHPHQYHRKKQ